MKRGGRMSPRGTDHEAEERLFSELGKRRRMSFSHRKETPLYYHTYLGLDRLLTSQQLMSAPAAVASTAAARLAGDTLASDAVSSGAVSSGAVPGAQAQPARCPFSGRPATTPDTATTPATPANGAAPGTTPVPNNTGGAHDEHLFIIIHQAFELWFKQILWELDDARRLMNQEYVPERSVAQVICRLTRVGEIFRLLVDQFTILETMSPLGFLEFRDYLFPASGFQSLQWRKIEQGLGLEAAARADYGERKFCAFLNAPHQRELRACKESMPSLHDLVSRWLERTPFAQSRRNSCGHLAKVQEVISESAHDATADTAADTAASVAASVVVTQTSTKSDSATPVLSSLWDHYRNGVAKMIQQDKDFVRRQAHMGAGGGGSSDEEATWSGNSSGEEAALGNNQRSLAHSASASASSSSSSPTTSLSSNDGAIEHRDDDSKLRKQLEEIDARAASLDMILDEAKFAEAQERGEVRFSHRAMQAALLITLYQDEPILHQASRLLRAIVDIDELMTVWRQRHSLMVHRMIGVKMGTGGSSGFHYLNRAAATHRVFKDLFNISTFLIPRHELPPLPAELRLRLAFVAEAD